MGNDHLFGYVLGEPEVRLGFNADVGMGFAAGAIVNWPGRMKSRIEGRRVLYLDAVKQNHLDVSHQWQWARWGNVSFRYERIERAVREDRISAGVTLYF